MVFRCSGVVGRNVYQFFILAVYYKHRLYAGRSKLLRVASGDFVVVAKPQENGSLDDDNDRLATVTTLAWLRAFLLSSSLASILVTSFASMGLDMRVPIPHESASSNVLGSKFSVMAEIGMLRA